MSRTSEMVSTNKSERNDRDRDRNLGKKSTPDGAQNTLRFTLNQIAEDVRRILRNEPCIRLTWTANQEAPKAERIYAKLIELGINPKAIKDVRVFRTTVQIMVPGSMDEEEFAKKLNVFTVGEVKMEYQRAQRQIQGVRVKFRNIPYEWTEAEVKTAFEALLQTEVKMAKVFRKFRSHISERKALVIFEKSPPLLTENDGRMAVEGMEVMSYHFVDVNPNAAAKRTEVRRNERNKTSEKDDEKPKKEHALKAVTSNKGTVEKEKDEKKNAEKSQMDQGRKEKEGNKDQESLLSEKKQGESPEAPHDHGTDKNDEEQELKTATKGSAPRSQPQLPLNAPLAPMKRGEQPKDKLKMDPTETPNKTQAEGGKQSVRPKRESSKKTD